jgi:phenylpyruvate tautomerase PptA (4-oxalocrotonate tautomerase family)
MRIGTAYRTLAPLGTRDERRRHMPLIRVELFDYRMNDETSAALIEKLTDALCEATHPGLRDHTWVIVEGHSPKNWGLGGKPWPVDQMPPGPSAG